MPDEDEKLMAVIYADKKIGEYLFLVNEINERRPKWAGNVASITRTVLETGLNAHRQGGVTSGQLRSLEGKVLDLKDILDGKK